MSTRIHLKGDNVTNVMKEIDELTGYMLYDAANKEVTTYTKAGNDSFYQIGKMILNDKIGERIKTKSVIIRHFDNGTPFRAEILTPESIQFFLNKHSAVITDIKRQVNENKVKEVEGQWNSVAGVIELYELAVKHNLEIRLH